MSFGLQQAVSIFMVRSRSEHIAHDAEAVVKALNESANRVVQGGLQGRYDDGRDYAVHEGGQLSGAGGWCDYLDAYVFSGEN